MSKTREEKSKCFVIMPISDPEGYDTGHFKRVYEYLIKPACDQAGLDCKRADDVKNTNHIVIDILQRILNSDIVVCDLSSRNPNVLYELGIRQAFDLPVVLIKDKQTDRVFDIQGLRTLDYDNTLRIDSVKQNTNALVTTIKKTLKSDPKDVNSLMKVLGVNKAELTSDTKLSPETSLILNSLKDISQRITKLEDNSPNSKTLDWTNRIFSGEVAPPKLEHSFPGGSKIKAGEDIFDASSAIHLGKFMYIDNNGIAIKADNQPPFIVSPDSDLYINLSPFPF